MKIVTILVVFVLLGACDSQKSDSPQETQADMPSIIESQLDVLDRAGEVEGMLDDAVNKREEEMRKRGI